MQLRFADLSGENSEHDPSSVALVARSSDSSGRHSRWSGVQEPCQNCHRGYHRAEVCRLPSGGAFKSYNNGGSKHYRGDSHNQQQQHHGSIQCFKCGERGHIRRFCRKDVSRPQAGSEAQAHVASTAQQLVQRYENDDHFSLLKGEPGMV